MALADTTYGALSTYPLTDYFTPPASCFNGPWTALATTTALPVPVLFSENNLNCQPNGVAAGQAAYSPGMCPVGFTTANATAVSSTTIAICCPSGFSVNSQGEASLCASTAAQATNTCVYAAGAAAGAACQATPIPSGAVFFVNNMEVLYQKGDLLLFPPNYTPSPLPSSTTSQSASASASKSPASGHHGLSTGAIAGLAVGIALFALLLIGAIVFVCCARKKRQAGVRNANQQGASAINEGKTQMESEVELVEEYKSHSKTNHVDGKTPMASVNSFATHSAGTHSVGPGSIA